ncbi:MAG: hypothetical protein AAB619_01325 [Patescibacteria group bacterium]
MMRLRLIGRILLAIAIVGLTVIGSRPTTAAGTGDSWQQPVTINVNARQFTDYRTLRATGDAVYYRLTVDQPRRVRIQISISRSAAAKFAPQVVLFRPHDTTVGPILPVEQPPETIALVYPMTAPRVVFDVFTQTLYTVRLEAQPVWPTAGTYIFAVYNAGSAGGQYRFLLDRGSAVAQWPDAWQLPIRWWRDQAFAGFSWLTFITPALIALGLWLVWLRLDHHQLHPHKKYPPRKAKNQAITR